MGEELDVWKCWGSSFGFFLWLCSRVVYIGAARLMGLFAANSSFKCLPFAESSTSRSFLGKSVYCKTGGGAGCFRFVGGARSRTIMLPI